MDLETEEQGRPVFVILYTACINSGKIRLYISQNQEGGGHVPNIENRRGTTLD